jgi:2-polyprenyl-3-methyl-5-hydroxy-6-metoxy-1,4-benzoquinol methylase
MGTSKGNAFAGKYADAKPEENADCPLCRSPERGVWYSMGPFNSVKCLECGTKYVTPRFDDNQFDEYYSETLFTESVDYEGRRHNMLDPEERARKRRDMEIEIGVVREALPDGGDVLDVGCQTGIFLEALPDGYRKHGVERSKWAAGKCAEITGGKIVNAKIEDAEFAENSFDAINMSYVMEHLPDPLPVTRKIASWLKPGGLMVVSIPNFDSFCARCFKEFYRLADPRQHIFLTTPKSLENVLSLSELTVERTWKPFWGTPYANPRELLRLPLNAIRKFFLPFSMAWGASPKPEKLVSPPFYGNIVVMAARKNGKDPNNDLLQKKF